MIKNKKQLDAWVINIAKKTHSIVTPTDFLDFNMMIGNPRHPNTGERTNIFDYQLEYFRAVVKYHKVILNKSRKIGATETALRIIAYNCFDHILKGKVIKGKYVGHKVMIIAGNKQSVANGFIKRFKNIFLDGFTDSNGIHWDYDDIILNEARDNVELFSGVEIKAFPANESARGEDNVICVFFSEAAFPGIVDDIKIYNAVEPNIENIQNSDFILESTPNGRQNEFYDRWDKAHMDPPQSDFYPIEQQYTVAVGKMLFKDNIEILKKTRTKAAFQQEFCCDFSTSGTQEFAEGEVQFDRSLDIDTFDDL